MINGDYNMSNIYTSRFIKLDDEKSNTCLFKLPTEWWNRFYEYKWAMNFVDEHDICLDAGCGIPHPFKFYLCTQCSNVYACDISANILNKDSILKSVANIFSDEDQNTAKKYIDDIHFSAANLTDLPYDNNMFSKIFCISILKFLSLDDISQSLHEFYRVLKPHGYLLITLDVPSVNLNTLVGIIYNTGFKFVGNLDLVKPSNAVYSDLPICLNCFRILLTK